MNPPSTKSVFCTFSCPLLRRDVTVLTKFGDEFSKELLSVFAFYLENLAFAQELPFVKNVLEMSILS